MMKRARLMAGLTPHEFGTLRAHSRSRRDERGPEIAVYRLDDRVLRRFSRRKCRYLTVSETFPLEIRALTIAIFYAIGTGLGGWPRRSFSAS